MDMNIRFDGKTVLITGASVGIGFASAQVFGGLGAKVAICGTNPAKLEKALKDLRAEGIEVFGEICDVASPAALDTFAAHVEAALGPIDVWISNAGAMPSYSLLDISEANWDRVMDVNAKSVCMGAQTAYRTMKDRGGVILIASSFASVIPSVGTGAYAAAKSAATSLIRTLAAELAPYNIRVNGYIPGIIETELTAPSRAASGEALKSAIALQRFGQATDVAWALAFLASDFASYITGTTLEISGGKLGTQNPQKAWQDKQAREQ